MVVFCSAKKTEVEFIDSSRNIDKRKILAIREVKAFLYLEEAL